MRERIVRHKIALILFVLWFFLASVFFLRVQEEKGLIVQAAALQQEINAMPQSPAKRRLLSMGESFSWIDSMPDFLMDLTQWAGSQSIVIVSIEPDLAEYKTGYAEQPVKLVLQGRFRAIGDYLTFLEDLPRPIQVTGLKLTSPSTVSPDLLAHLDLVVYIRGET